MGQDLGFYGYYDWFGPPFDGVETALPGTERHMLRLKKRISHRVIGLLNEYSVLTAIAVYLADMFSPEGEPSREVIVKLFMQIPNLGTDSAPSKLSLNPQDYSTQAVTESEEYANEANALRYLTSAGCSSAPHLIADYSEQNPYILDGFLYVIVMEKLPGKSLAEVWDTNRISLATQNLIQEKALEAVSEVYVNGIEHGDERSRNLLWDEENEKCYVVDFDNSTMEQRGVRLDVSSEKDWFHFFALWGLVTEEMRERRKARSP